jgi:hypothetical protein
VLIGCVKELRVQRCFRRTTESVCELLLMFCFDTQFVWVGEVPTVDCTRDERNGLAWFKIDTSKQKDEARI